MPPMIMEHIVSPKQELLRTIGDISSVEIFNNQVLVAVYIRPQKTKSGIFLTNQTVDEDRYQSKVGLIIKKGKSAFVDESGKWFDGISVDIHEWIVFRPSDGWSITVNGILCRMIDDINVRATIDNPDRVW